MPAIDVTCDDPGLRQRVSDWLADLRLEPPSALTMCVLQTPDVVPPADARAPFLQPEVEIRSGPPDHLLRLDWRLGEASAVIPRRASGAEVVLGPGAMASFDNLAAGFLTAVVVFLLRRAGWHHLHAATAVDPGGRAWLLAGDSRSGKSTTAALLAARGWQVGCDDLAFITRSGNGIEVVAAHAPIRLREGGLSLLGRAAPRALRGKAAFLPEELGGTWISRIRPDVIVLPRVAGTATTMTRASAAESLAALVRWSAWVALEPDLADEHLGLIGDLAAQAPCHHLSLAPDLYQSPAVLERLAS